MWKLRKLYTVAALMLLAGCNLKNINEYTLYRSSPLDPNMRIHMATFDSSAGAESTPTYNQENCELAANLFQSQQGVKVKYWCEKGRYRE